MPKLGLLIPGSRATHGKWVDALVSRLAELGWTDGRSIAIEFKWAEGHPERYAALASEFAAINPNLIFATETASVLAVRQAAPAAPVVFAGLTDPIASGVVTSLRRPGGNVTGVSGQSFELGSKRLGLLAEAMPQLRRLAVLRNAAEPTAALELASVQAAARVLAVKVTTVDVKTADEIAPAIAALKDKAQAVYVVTDPLLLASHAQIGSAALDARLATVHGLRDYVEAGGLMSYGTDTADLYRRAGDMIDKILRGTKPATMPVQAPTKFELVINLKTAKTLGLTMPPLLVKRADEVIEG